MDSETLKVLPSHIADALNENPWFTRKQAAAYIGKKMQTLASWDCRKKWGLKCTKVGGRAMYRKSDLDEFLSGGCST